RALPRSPRRRPPLVPRGGRAQPALLAPLGAGGAEGGVVKRLAVLLVLLAALIAPAAAAAHPLGNFTTNRYARIEVSGDRLYALYVLDLAEIPTYQARGEVRRLGRDGYAA